MSKRLCRSARKRAQRRRFVYRKAGGPFAELMVYYMDPRFIALLVNAGVKPETFLSPEEVRWYDNYVTLLPVAEEKGGAALITHEDDVIFTVTLPT